MQLPSSKWLRLSWTGPNGEEGYWSWRPAIGLLRSKKTRSEISEVLDNVFPSWKHHLEVSLTEPASSERRALNLKQHPLLSLKFSDEWRKILEEALDDDEASSED